MCSDLSLLRGDLDGVATAFELSRRTYLTIVENLVWAFGYNAAAIPLAAAVLLNPIVAVAAMALSSISVVRNPLRLRRFACRQRVPVLHPASSGPTYGRAGTPARGPSH